MKEAPYPKSMNVPGIAQTEKPITILMERAKTQRSCRQAVALVARDIAHDIQDLTVFDNLQVIPIESSEATKSISFRDLFFTEHRAILETMDTLIVVGGGTVLNFGTALATLLTERTLGHLPRKETVERPDFRLILIPTTVLSMADAAYGSAGLLNDGPIKNAYNVKFDPDEILLNPDYLTTLPIIEKKRGVVECLKHAIMQEAQDNDDAPTIAECIALLTSKAPDDDALFACILKTIKARAHIARAVNAGNEMAGYLPSYGHLDVEPREVASGYKLAHGDAVLFGLMLEASLSGATHITEILREALPFTPLADNLPFLDYDSDHMERAYRDAVRPRFRTGENNVYKAIALTRAGQFADLDAQTDIPLMTYSFKTIYAEIQHILSSIRTTALKLSPDSHMSGLCL